MTTTATKERPILFSGPMVQAILDGRKTQTRRVMKPQPHPWPKRGEGVWSMPTGPDRWTTNERRETRFADFGESFTREWVMPVSEWLATFPCPYGAPGDRLWVRETHAEGDDEYGAPHMVYRADMASAHIGAKGDRGKEEYSILYEPKLQGVEVDRWKPSIHMPRWASRITLEITSTRVECLHEITEDDAKAEGVEMGFHFHGHAADRHPPMPIGHRPMFIRVWDEINGKTYPWASNPWVWVVSFRRVSK